MRATFYLIKNSRRSLQSFQRQVGLFIVPKQTFFISKWINFSKEDNSINVQKGKAMKQSSDAGYIQDFDDKFGLAKIGDPSAIFAHLEDCQYSYSMNDLVYFLRKLVELHKERKQFKDRKEFKALVNEIKERLESGKHELYPWIGSYAKCFKELEVYDKKLWELLEYKINEDAWYTNYKESLHALEGFTVFKATNDQPRIDTLYQKIERVVNITVWDQNMVHYKRIVESLAEVNRFDPVIFNNIEMYIMRNMSFEYEIKTIVDILYAFGKYIDIDLKAQSSIVIGKGGMGHREFYDAAQFAIFKGHLFHRNPLLRIVELPYNGETTSKLLSTFTNAKHRISDFELNPNFVLYMYKMLMSNNTKYTLVNLIETLKYLGRFEFDTQDEIEDHLINQILKVEGNVDFQGIQQAVEYLTYRYCGEYEKTPAAIQNKLFEYFRKGIEDSQPEQLLDMHLFMLRRNLLTGKQGEIILSSVLSYLNERMLQIEPKQIEQLLMQTQEHIEKLTQNKEANIGQFTTSQNKISDYLLVCKLSKQQNIENLSQPEEIPKLQSDYSPYV